MLHRHFKKLVDAFEHHATAVRKKATRKNVHDLRVTIKRIRAFLLLVQHLDNRCVMKLKHAQKLIKIFRKAGRIRDAQMESMILKKWKQKPHRQPATQCRVKRLQQALRVFSKLKAWRKFQQACMPVFTQWRKPELTGAIFDFSVHQIEKALRLVERGSVHSARKKLKTAHYVLEILSEKNAQAARLITLVKPLEDQTGHFLDQLHVVHSLKKKPALSYEHLIQQMEDDIARRQADIRHSFRELQQQLPALLNGER